MALRRPSGAGVATVVAAGLEEPLAILKLLDREVDPWLSL